MSRWTAHGTHKGDLMGNAPTGKQVTLKNLSMDEFGSHRKDGIDRIVHHLEDEAAMIGLVKIPAKKQDINVHPLEK